MSLCFLLTAGQGTRLKPFTDIVPKPAIPFFNLPLAYYGFYLARKGGFGNFIMNKHHLPEKIDKLARDLSGFCDSIQTIDETCQLLGSGGALWNARDILSKEDHFLIANGDEVLFPSDESVLCHLFNKHSSSSALCTLLTTDHPELLKSLKAVWVDEEGFVQGFGMEPPRQGLKPVHYTGYKTFSKKIFAWLPEGESNIFYEVLVKAIEKGEKIATHHMPESSWYETGSFGFYMDAHRQSVENNWKAVNLRRSYFGQTELFKEENNSGLLVCETEAQLKFHDQCDDTVFLCAGSSIKDGTKVKKSVILASIEVGETENKIILGE